MLSDVRMPPGNDEYPIIAALFSNGRFKNHEIAVNALSLTILELICKNQIICEIDFDKSHSIAKKLTQQDLEVRKGIRLRISAKGELKTSQSVALNLLKTMNKARKFNLREMLKKSNSKSIAGKFERDFLEFSKAIQSENGYTPKDYKDILENGKLTRKGKDLKRQWKNFQKYLKSGKLTEKYPPQSVEENSSQIIYAACFDIEKEALSHRENNSPLTNFIDKDGYKMLNVIFANALSNVPEKRKWDGSFHGLTDKYVMPT